MAVVKKLHSKVTDISCFQDETKCAFFFDIGYIIEDRKHPGVVIMKEGLNVSWQTSERCVVQNSMIEAIPVLRERLAFQDMRIPKKMNNGHEMENVKMLDDLREQKRELVLIIEQDVDVITGRRAGRSNCNTFNHVERKRL